MKKLLISVFSILVIILSFNSTVSAQEAYVGEIRMFAGQFPPTGWAFCYGQELNVADYPDLYSVIGFTFGGNKTTTFALPDLQGAVPQGTKVVAYPEPITNNIKPGDVKTYHVGTENKEQTNQEVKFIGIHYIICTKGILPRQN